MKIKIFSVIIKRYMSNLKIVILRPWTEQGHKLAFKFHSS
jgi:hypothetical protein